MGFWPGVIPTLKAGFHSAGCPPNQPMPARPSQSAARLRRSTFLAPCVHAFRLMSTFLSPRAAFSVLLFLFFSLSLLVLLQKHLQDLFASSSTQVVITFLFTLQLDPYCNKILPMTQWHLCFINHLHLIIAFKNVDVFPRGNC